jgi:periplasmic protein TonB
MFDELVESSVVRKKTNKGWAVILSTIVQLGILIVLILIPLIYTQALPKAMLATMITAPPPPPPPPPPPAAEAPKIVRQPPRLITQGKLMQPHAIPKQVAVFKEEALPPEPPAAAEGLLGGLGSGDILGGLGNVASGVAPPPAPKTPTRIKLGGSVQEAKIISRPAPSYPALAKQARIQGAVVLHAIIDKDGNVTQLEVVSGHPLLVQAALQAVKQWRYQPTQLNGEPVEVDTTITVNFVLGG